MGKLKTLWSCSECGHAQAKWAGSCSVCHKWNTFVEEVEVEGEARFESAPKRSAEPIRLSACKEIKVSRIPTGIGEFDRLMGGGIVPGSLSLVGGDPGIGKSTLMLQIAQALSAQGLIVLYVCGEESVEQTALRAQRLGLQSDTLYLLAETLFSKIKLHIDALQPQILIVDSIQILYKQEIPSSPGSVSQVREITTEFMHIAKGMGISTFLIGHVTKTGEIAGPRVLEHLVDTVLDFDGDLQHGYRMLRGIKNRFGPTDDLAIFQMTVGGLKEVINPSSFFLEERAKRDLGSIIIPTIEGSRPFLVEVQSLVVHSAFASPMRKSTGLNPNRLSLWLAVLEKKLGYHLHQRDVFVSIAGGLKLNEPAIDLGVMMAIASSFSHRSLPHKWVVMGEVGLGGEIRTISRLESRLKEAMNMGFEGAIIPERNLKEVGHVQQKNFILYPVDQIETAINYLQMTTTSKEQKKRVVEEKELLV